MRRPLRGFALMLCLSALVLPVRHPARAQEAPAQAEAAPADTTKPRQAEVAADSLVGMRLDGEAIRRLLGSVFVRQDSTVLLSHRALQYLDRETFLFTGSVLIVERGDSLRADSVFYDKRTKLGRARGNVYLTDGDVQVRAPSALYFANEKRARFEDGLTLVDSAATLTSRAGTYWSDEKRAELDGDVHLQGERTYLEADSLTYFRETEVSIARGDVFIERRGGEDEAAADSTLRTLLFSQYAYSDEQAGYSRMRGQPLLLQLRQDSADADVDSLLIRAVRLESIRQDSARRLIAVGAVEIWQQDFAAVADSVIYERFDPPADSLDASEEVVAFASADTTAAFVVGDSARTEAPGARQAGGRPEETRLFGQPIAWIQEAQVTGDTIRVKGRDGAIDSLFVRQRAFVAQRDSVTGRIQQLKGQHLVGVLLDDSTRVFTLAPNAEVIYFQHDDQDQPDGGIQASGDRAVFRVRGEEPERIAFSGEPQGTYYPEGQVPEPFQLEGFRWEPDRRPTQAGLLGPERILQRLREEAAPPSPESPFQALPPPAEAAPPDSSLVLDPVAGPAGAPAAERPAPDRSRGGWTIVVGSETDRRRADILAGRMQPGLEATGYTIAVYSAAEDGGTRYRVGLGFFSELEGARGVLGRLADRLPPDAWLLRVPAPP